MADKIQWQLRQFNGNIIYLHKRNITDPVNCVLGTGISANTLIHKSDHHMAQTHFLNCWYFVRQNPWSLTNLQLHVTLMISLSLAWTTFKKQLRSRWFERRICNTANPLRFIKHKLRHRTRNCLAMLEEEILRKPISAHRGECLLSTCYTQTINVVCCENRHMTFLDTELCDIAWTKSCKNCKYIIICRKNIPAR